MSVVLLLPSPAGNSVDYQDPGIPNRKPARLPVPVSDVQESVSGTRGKHGLFPRHVLQREAGMQLALVLRVLRPFEQDCGMVQRK